jgi:ketosteroid isomerase-like protein
MNTNAIVAEVRATDDRRVKSLLDKDYAALAQLLSDKLVYHHASGKVDNKDSYLSEFLSGKVCFVSSNRRNVIIDVIGDTVVCSGIAENEVSVDGTTVLVKSRYFSVWARQHSGWQMVAWSSAALA